MTESECHDFLVQTCKQLEAEDHVLRFDIRKTGISEEEKVVLGVLFQVIVTHRKLEEEFTTGKRESYNYYVCDITIDAMTYKDPQYFAYRLKDAAECVKSQIEN